MTYHAKPIQAQIFAYKGQLGFLQPEDLDKVARRPENTITAWQIVEGEGAEEKLLVTVYSETNAIILVDRLNLLSIER